MNEFYVYALYDPRTNIPFYVGKGKGRRCYDHNSENDKKPNPKKRELINAIQADGFILTVKFIEKDLEENEAFMVETAWIRNLGRMDENAGPLFNLTNGGEGTSGYKHSEKTKQKMRERMTGHIVSKETRQKLSQVSKGNKSWAGKTHSEETKRKQSAALKGRVLSEEHKRNISKAKQNISRETKQKLSQAAKKRIMTEETKQKHRERMKGNQYSLGQIHSKESRQKMSKAQTGQKNHFYGKTHSEETKQKLKDAWAKRKAQA